MEHATVVTRTIDLDLPAHEAWSLIGDAQGWAGWMVDEADVAVEPGGEGSVRDADTERQVRVTEVVSGERVTFAWWVPGDEGSASHVELVVVPAGGGAVLHIAETFPARHRPAAAGASVAWEVRATCAWARCMALAPVA